MPPRLTLAELTAKGNTLYGAAQDGAIIYITTISGGGDTQGQREYIVSKGLYLFDAEAANNEDAGCVYIVLLLSDKRLNFNHYQAALVRFFFFKS